MHSLDITTTQVSRAARRVDLSKSERQWRAWAICTEFHYNMGKYGGQIRE